MKKLFLVIVALSFVLSLSGCNDSRSVNTRKASHDQAKEILRCLDEDDAEGLKSLFCEKVASSHDLDKEIAEAMDFYEGKSVSFGNIVVRGGDSLRDGEWTDIHIGYLIEKIQTDTDKNEYKINTHSYLINKDNPTCIGITYLHIYNTETGDKVEIGEFVK
jgi:hydrogenase maturation factor